MQTFPSQAVVKATSRRQAVYEQIPSIDNESFIWRCDDYPCIQNVCNVHPEYEIHLIRNAAGVAFIGDYVGRFEPGYLAIVGGGLPHDWMTATTPGQVIRGRDIVLQFDVNRLRKAGAGFPEIAQLETFLQLALRGLVFSGKTRQAGADLLEQMGPAKGLQRVALFLQLLSLLAGSSEFEVLSEQESLHSIDLDTLDKFHCVMAYIAQNFQTAIRLSDLAKMIGMSDSSFSRFFKRNTGNSYIAHITKLRIGRACQILSNTDMPITDICFQIGYSNISNFNRKFLSCKGTTPSQYRRLARHRSGLASVS